MRFAAGGSQRGQYFAAGAGIRSFGLRCLVSGGGDSEWRSAGNPGCRAGKSRPEGRSGDIGWFAATETEVIRREEANDKTIDPSFILREAEMKR